jgi:hypothetical protein
MTVLEIIKTSTEQFNNLIVDIEMLNRNQNYVNDEQALQCRKLLINSHLAKFKNSFDALCEVIKGY